jgi:hypothetical protein
MLPPFFQQVLNQADIEVRPGFPWQDSSQYPIVVAHPTVCSYSFQTADGFFAFFFGRATVTKSPLAYKGSFIDLVIGALSPNPRGQQDVQLTCSFPDNL